MLGAVFDGQMVPGVPQQHLPPAAGHFLDDRILRTLPRAIKLIGIRIGEVTQIPQ